MRNDNLLHKRINSKSDKRISLFVAQCSKRSLQKTGFDYLAKSYQRFLYYVVISFLSKFGNQMLRKE